MFGIRLRSVSGILGTSAATSFAVAVVFAMVFAVADAHAAEKIPGEATLEEVKVVGQAPQDGGAETGYAAKKLNSVGFLGERTQLETPYSYSVIPSELIENIQASSPDRVMRLDPFTQLGVPSSRGFNTNANIRGFVASQLYEGQRDDGPYVDLEDKERVEILNGLSGFLYPNRTPGGSINYVLKRPTQARLANVTIGDYGGSSFYGHVDLGGKLGESGRIGYRLNALVQEGDTSVDGQNIRRQLFSGALDFRLADNLLWQLDYSYGYRKTNGIDAYWSTAAGVVHPGAPDAGKTWGQKWSFWEQEINRAGTNLDWKINEAFGLRAAFRVLDRSSRDLYANNTFDASGTYTSLISYSSKGKTRRYEGYALADLALNTGGIKHKLTGGFTGDVTRNETPQVPFANLGSTTGLPLSSPTEIAQPAYQTSPRAKSSVTWNENFVLADEIVFNDSWTLLAGLTHATIRTDNFSTTTGAKTSAYDKSKNVFSVSLLYRITPKITAYATWLEGLEPGGTAAATYNGKPVTNAGTTMAPVENTQYEIGAKFALGEALLTVALFDLKRASDVYTPNGGDSYTYSEDGEAEHKGIEIGLSGKVTRNLSLYGGVTAMDVKVTKNPSTPALVGKKPTNISERMAKLYAEYDIPGVPGLTLTGGAAYVGSFYADTANADKLPGYTVGYLGARYQTRVAGVTSIFRLDIDNIGNKNYWESGGYVGSPRTILFSGQVKF